MGTAAYAPYHLVLIVRIVLGAFLKLEAIGCPPTSSTVPGRS